jgi:hypothetical protein
MSSDDLFDLCPTRFSLFWYRGNSKVDEKREKITDVSGPLKLHVVFGCITFVAACFLDMTCISSDSRVIYV